MFQRRHFNRDQWSLLSFGSQVNYLFLNLVAPFTNAGVRALSALEGLSAINLFGTQGHSAFDPSGSSVTAGCLESLSLLPNLQWLGCCSQLCTDQALVQISRMPELRFLMCQDAVAGDLGFASLRNSESLEFIWGRRCYGLTGMGFRSLAGLPRLRGLSVSLRNVDEPSLAALKDFKELREFMPIDITDEGFRHVGECARLEAIHCMYCPAMTDEATPHLERLEHLQTYQAWSSQITDSSLAALSRIQTLKTLLFSRCDSLSDQGVASLAHLPKLEQLSLEHLPHVTEDVVLSFPARVNVNVQR